MEQIKGNHPEEETTMPDQRADLAEKSVFFDEHPDLIQPDFNWLNNWRFHLPGGLREQLNNRRNDWDMRISDDYEKGTEKPPLLSEKYFNGTRKEFFENMKLACEEVHVSEDEIREMNRRLAEADKKIRSGGKNQEERDRILQDLFELTLPVYKKLREYGYSHYDLVQ